VRRPERVVVSSRSGGERYAEEMRRKHDIHVAVVPEIEEAVRGSQIVVTTTTSRQPLIRAEWIEPGTHVTAMGSDFPDKHELDTDVIWEADVVAADDPPVAARNGELHHALDAGAIQLDQVVPLGALVTGAAEGRISDRQITVCDLVGVGVQDAAIAGEVVRRAGIAG
jgi:ornithine cyclodeaminase/alanine dehydrogenase-like protein (mu-crystallin family)